MSDELSGIYSFPAHIVRETDGERATETDLLALAKDQRAYDPKVFDEHDAAFFRGEISSDRVDAYYTQMLPTSLKNYAADAEAGVAVLTGHEHRNIPFGRSLTGVYSDGRKTGVKRVTSDFFTLRDLVLNGQPTNDLIDAMRASLVADMSIGFSGGKMFCNICKRDMLRDWECWHIPGFRYDPSKPDGHEVVEGGTLCVGGIDSAHLAEYSMVYSGATPGAGLTKARQEVAAGRAKGDFVRQIEARYRVPMPDARLVSPGVTVALDERAQRTQTSEGDTGVGDEGTENVAATRDTVVRALRAAGFAVPDDARSIDDVVRFLGSEREKQVAEIARLKPLADDGTRARVDFIDQTLLAGGRAHDAASWKPEEWKTRLERWSLEDIIAQRASWIAMGDKMLGVGGRVTVDAPPMNPQPADMTGARAFSVDDLDKLAHAAR